MQDQKLAFIKNDLLALLNALPEDAPASWGKMNAQQMLEHMAAIFDVSADKMKFELVTPEEHLPKYKEFILSDKQFRENTKAPISVIGEEPLPLQFATYAIALENVKQSVEYFEQYFSDDPEKKTLHPVFGPLNFEEWVLLHYKHVTHHLRQFDIPC